MGLPLFMEMDMTTALHGPVWILGMPFLRAYSATFNRDRREIGLAQLPLGSDLCTHCNDAPVGPPSSHARGGARYSDVDADGQPPPHEEAPALQAVGDVFQEPHASHVGPAYGPHGSEGAPSPRAAFVTWQPLSTLIVSFP